MVLSEPWKSSNIYWSTYNGFWIITAIDPPSIEDLLSSSCLSDQSLSTKELVQESHLDKTELTSELVLFTWSNNGPSHRWLASAKESTLLVNQLFLFLIIFSGFLKLHKVGFYAPFSVDSFSGQFHLSCSSFWSSVSSISNFICSYIS